MLSKIIQQSVIAATAINVANSIINRSNFVQQEQSQIISRSISKSQLNRWITFDIEFFDFVYNIKSMFIEKFIKHAEKKAYFNNVHLFLEQVKNVVKIENTT